MLLMEVLDEDNTSAASMQRIKITLVRKPMRLNSLLPVQLYWIRGKYLNAGAHHSGNLLSSETTNILYRYCRFERKDHILPQDGLIRGPIHVASASGSMPEPCPRTSLQNRLHLRSASACCRMIFHSGALMLNQPSFNLEQLHVR